MPVAAGKKKVPVAPNVKQYVKACMDKIIETKYTNITVAQTNISTSGVVNGAILCGITQGLTDGQRTGNHIRVREISLKGYFLDTVPAVGRIVLFGTNNRTVLLPRLVSLLVKETPAGSTTTIQLLDLAERDSLLFVILERRLFQRFQQLTESSC